MTSCLPKLSLLLFFSFWTNAVFAQEKVEVPAQQNKSSMEKKPSAAQTPGKSILDIGSGQKNNQGIAAKEPDPAKSKNEADADAEKNPASGPRISTPIRRDPFRPFTLNVRGNSTRRRENLSPLERYELGQLKLVGVIWDVKEPNAMVEDAAGLGYRVKVGTPIGANEGKVKTIQQDGIVVEEFQVDLYGARTKHEVKIRLSPEKAE